MTERSLSAELKATAESPEFRYVVLVALSFPSGTVRVHNGVGTHSFGGNDYLGVGAFGNIEAMAESSALIDNPIKLILSSVTQEIIDAIRTDDVYGRDADIYLGALDEDGQLDGTPTNWVTGYMEKKEIAIGEESQISITLQTRAGRLAKRNNRRWTIEEHQVEYPTDLFFEFLPYVIEANVPWGGGPVQTGTSSRSNDDMDPHSNSDPADISPGYQGG